MEEKKRKIRGFSAMSPEKQREIAGMGGRAAHAAGRAHRFTPEEARSASLKRRSIGIRAEHAPISADTPK